MLGLLGRIEGSILSTDLLEPTCMSAEHLVSGIEAQYTAEFIHLSRPKTTITKNGRRKKDEDRDDIFADGTLENAWLADQCVLLAQAVCSDAPNAKELALDIMLMLNPAD